MKKKILYNISASLMLEIVTVVCAFVLPRMIISGYGSEYNGIVSSVTQFLSVVTLLRSGVGGVTRAALYRPLVENDTAKISAIVNATEHFMRKIAGVFVVFLLAFAAGYPFLVSEEFGWLFTFSLVLILGISTIAQYYFGITYQFLLSADQKSYVYSIFQTFATILNTVFSVLLINAGVEFRLMKLISAIVFAAIPIALYWYVHRNYSIVRSIPRDDSCIKQRWDAFAHQVAAFVHSNTAIILLTVFSDLYQVSVYSVYNMVVTGVKKMVTVFTSGMESTIGKLIAASEKKKLDSFVETYEWCMNVLTVVVFSCTAILIAPFVSVYTANVTDADYIQPMLGLLLVIGAFFSCVRLPYQNMVESAGHFRNTRNGAIAEAIINIGLSLVLITFLGSVGVAVAAAFATAFRTMQYAMYSNKRILGRSYAYLMKRVLVTLINLISILLPYYLFEIDEYLLEKATSYLAWVKEAIVVFVLVVIGTLLINIVAYRRVFQNAMRYITTRKSNSL